MNKKYELTNETIEYLGHTLHRIVALKDFSDVKAGDKGGYIESEDNLDQTGCAWVYDSAKACQRAKVQSNAVVKGNAAVFGDAIISLRATVSGYAMVYGTSHIFGYAVVGGTAAIYDSAVIKGDAKVYNTAIGGQAVIADNAVVNSVYDVMVIGPFFGPLERSQYISFYKLGSGGIGVYNGAKYELTEFLEFIEASDPDDVEVFTAAVELAKLKLGE